MAIDICPKLKGLKPEYNKRIGLILTLNSSKSIVKYKLQIDMLIFCIHKINSTAIYSAFFVSVNNIDFLSR